MLMIDTTDVKRQIRRLIAKTNDICRTFKKNRYLKSDRVPWRAGYEEYKYDFIGDFINSEEMSAFTEKKLPHGFGYRIDERCVEYPWFFSRIKDNEGIILDAGSVLNFPQVLRSRKLAGRKLYIATLAYEGRVECPSSPSYIYEDLRDTCLRDSFFDAVCSLSTVEHIGLDNTMLYTSDESKRENNRYDYLRAILEYKRVLKPGGTLYLSVPFGAYRNHGWFQVFDSDMVFRLIDSFGPASAQATYFKYERDQWNFSNEESCREGTFFDIRERTDFEPDYLAGARCVVCLEMIKDAR